MIPVLTPRRKIARSCSKGTRCMRVRTAFRASKGQWLIVEAGKDCDAALFGQLDGFCPVEEEGAVGGDAQGGGAGGGQVADRGKAHHGDVEAHVLPGLCDLDEDDAVPGKGVAAAD